MADGHVELEINEQGEARVKEVNYLDIRLTCLDIEHDDIASQLSAQLPQEMKDVLMLAVIKVEFLMSHHWEYGTECDGVDIELLSHSILKENYKEFYREMVTEEVKLVAILDGSDVVFHEDIERDDRMYYNNLIGDWEEFYDEDFKPFQKQIIAMDDKKINLQALLNNQ